MTYRYKSLSFIVMSLIIILLSSCSEPFDYKYKDQEPILVVEGKISNQPGPYYIRLSESINKIIAPNSSGISSNVSKPIADAVVSLTDDAGHTERLRYTGFNESRNAQLNDRYVIENISGVVGRTYTLTIEWKGKIYTATDKMEAVPVIDKVDFKIKHMEIGKDDATVPLIYFKEPQDVKNYYLVYYTIDGMIGSGRSWNFSIINDDYLEANVNGLEVDDGQSPSGRDFYAHILEGSQVVVYLESLSKPVFDFYEATIRQFGADGGAFSPSPASPPSNISGGALGVFRASAVSQKSTVK